MLKPENKAGDQCPFCFLADYDCDGILRDVAQGDKG